MKSKIGSESDWSREYLLKIISDEDRVVHPEWIHYYDALPEEPPRLIVSGVDLAISQKQTADYTAIVSAYVYGYNQDTKIYILANPVNKRLTFPESLKKIKEISTKIGKGTRTKIFIEDVAYQASIIQQLVVDGFPAESVKVYGQDKKSRLTLTTDFLKAPKIFFARHGNELLINQLTGFGVEKYDDLVDAFTILVTQILQMDEPQTNTVVSFDPIFSPSKIDGRRYGPTSFDEVF